MDCSINSNIQTKSLTENSCVQLVYMSRCLHFNAFTAQRVCRSVDTDVEASPRRSTSSWVASLNLFLGGATLSVGSAALPIYIVIDVQFIQLDSEDIMGFYACLQIKQAVCVISYGVMYLHNQTCFVLVLHKVTDLYFNWCHDY